MTNVDHLLMSLFAIYIFSLVTRLFMSFPHFLNWIVFLLLFRELFIKDTSQLSRGQFANIFSQSVTFSFS